MKNKAGLFLGFAVGMAGFLGMFKIVFLDNIAPEDEIAPGFVMLTAIFSGVVFAFFGSRIQHHFSRKRSAG